MAATLVRVLLRASSSSRPLVCLRGRVVAPVLAAPTRRRTLTTTPAPKEKQMVPVTFVRGDGERITVKGKVGDNLLDVVVNNNVDLDGYGACEGTLSCSTCHLVLKREDYDKLPEKPTDEELDMLDLAYGLSDTSRLGCQVCLSKDMEGLEVQVPAGVNDARE